mmetsp:Transcript_130880/g.406974  ORF Transcript_130880/g.406974 Transcript_130880/m.406974 type:complete len:91 (+) Transcript_130880:3-275(+)
MGSRAIKRIMPQAGKVVYARWCRSHLKDFHQRHKPKGWRKVTAGTLDELMLPHLWEAKWHSRQSRPLRFLKGSTVYLAQYMKHLCSARSA